MRVTQAGELLLRALRPALKDISAELMALGDMRDKPAGTVRITTFLYAAMQVLWPVLPGFLATYPVLLAVVGSMPGSLKMSVVLFRSRSLDRWWSTTATRSCGQRWRGRAWPMCMRSPPSPGAASTVGVNRGLAQPRRPPPVGRAVVVVGLMQRRN